MRSYIERYEADEVCNEGHDKRAGSPCEQCAEEATLPPVLRIGSSRPPAAEPPYACCQSSHDDSGQT